MSLQAASPKLRRPRAAASGPRAEIPVRTPTPPRRSTCGSDRTIKLRLPGTGPDRDGTQPGETCPEAPPQRREPDPGTPAAWCYRRRAGDGLLSMRSARLRPPQATVWRDGTQTSAQRRDHRHRPGRRTRPDRGTRSRRLRGRRRRQVLLQVIAATRRMPRTRSARQYV